MNNFPDLPHLRQLQKDLWSWPKSRAAVMVGAGLSLNAEPLPGVTTRFVTWRQLVRVMFDELYPLLRDENPQQREERFAGTNPLRIASEYESAFGRRKLELLLLSQNPDSDFQPSRLHKLLLQLPWADVFTTNYDTLLERTEVPERAYQPVIKAEELTTAFSPRIVKLHGSFPSQTPFIISEEDYRTYPRNFAPLVNSVQQSLLENAFVLLGFSGDDPNFLAWTGWIRDELGDHHAPIYLVGALSLQPHQRSLLAHRGVTPIDLTPLFATLNPPQGIHAAAIEWFLSSLAAGKVPRPEKWPDFRQKQALDIIGCPPILKREDNEAVDENLSLGPQKAVDFESASKILSKWRIERMRYPGWLILGANKRSELWTYTKSWIDPLLIYSKTLSAADRLALIYEINWRLEVSLIPLFDDWGDHFKNAAGDVFLDLLSGKIPECSVLTFTPNLTGAGFISAWFSVAFTLLRDFRESYDKEQWEVQKCQIDKLISQYPEYTDRANYEAVLWEMWNLEHDAAKEKLARWQPSPRSPLFGIRKAGILAELDELGEARTLLRTALAEIRKALINHGNNIEILSLEGWCTYLLGSVESAQDLKKYYEIREEFWERWEELKAWDCSPWPHKDYFDEALSKPPPKPHKTEVIKRGFDPGHLSRTRHWLGDTIQEYLPAFACIRFYEQVGIPLRLRRINVIGDTLDRACQWVAPFMPFWSPTLLIRAGKTKVFEEGNFLSRSAVATMDQGLATRLYQWCFQIFERQVAKLSGTIPMESAQEAILEPLPEVLSRLCLRVDEETLRKTLPLVLQFNKQQGVKAHIRMHDSADTWFQRLFYAASGKLLLEWLPQLIRAPLLEEGIPLQIPIGYAWPDPMSKFPSSQASKAGKQNQDLVEKVQKETDWLLRRTSSESGEAYKRALMRLISVFHSKCMHQDQADYLGRLLWSNLNEHSLPLHGRLRAFGFLHLPAPPDIDVINIVKQYILSLSENGVVVRNPEGQLSISVIWFKHPLITEALLASKPIVHLRDEARGTIEWSSEDTEVLYKKASNWWKIDRAAFDIADRSNPFAAGGTDPVLNTLNEMGSFFSRAILPKMDWATEDTWSELLGWLAEIRRFGAFPTVAFPYILMHRPSHADAFASIIIEDLNSDKPEAVEAAAEATRRWLHLAELKRIPVPSSDIILPLINRVLFRRKAGISPCINELSYLIVELPKTLTPATISILENSLIPWHLATILPPSENDADEFQVVERPDLRVDIAHLAAALGVWRKITNLNDSESPPVQFWRDICKSDPLPEIRRAFEIWE